MRRQKGYSMVMWVSVFAVVVAAVFFIRTPLKRAIQAKIMGTADYMLWTSWDGKPARQYKGEDTSFVKTQTTQDVATTQAEYKGYIRTDAESTVVEDTVSSGVEEGSQPVLKALDIN